MSNDSVMIAVHKETGSVARNVRNPGAGYELQEYDKDYSQHLTLRFDHLEDHRASTTAWFREVSYDKWNDSYHPQEPPRFFPMRVREFTKLLLEGRDMLRLEGFFGFSKQGSGVGLVFRGEGYGQ